jgi:lincosamide nucleotidyltransferase A/C/D/E
LPREPGGPAHDGFPDAFGFFALGATAGRSDHWCGAACGVGSIASGSGLDPFFGFAFLGFAERSSVSSSSSSIPGGVVFDAVPGAQAALASPCASCAGHAFTETVSVFLPLWQTVTFPPPAGAAACCPDALVCASAAPTATSATTAPAATAISRSLRYLDTLLMRAPSPTGLQVLNPMSTAAWNRHIPRRAMLAPVQGTDTWLYRERRPRHAMEAEEVTRLVAGLEENGVVVWLDGGWGVDALLGEQVREHDDLDLVVELTAVAALTATLQQRGYSLVAGAPPKSFVLVDAVGRQVDVHPVAFDAEGGGVYRTDDDRDWTYPAEGFTGRGRIGCTPVRCLSPVVQVLVHDGYELAEKDYLELVLLRERFGVALPPRVEEALSPGAGGRARR